VTDRADRPVIFWFRQDLRLADNPGLLAAAESGRPLVAAFVLDDETPGLWRLGGAARWWLHHSLVALDRSLAALGGSLVLRRGKAAEAIPALVRETAAAAVYWNRCYEPFAVARDASLKRTVAESGIAVHSFNASLLYEPWTALNRQGKPFAVFAAFWRACLAQGAPSAPLPPARRLVFAPGSARNSLDAWRLTPSRPNWARGFDGRWTPGEAGAQRRLAEFLDHGARNYIGLRDRLDLNATSRLSPHLRFGEIGPRQVWHAIAAAGAAHSWPRQAVERFLSELGWREFAHSLLYHHPELPCAPLRTAFAQFPWQADANHLAAWQRGCTGYPIVDAAMRELWATGWMPNRARMIVASFLVKHLLIPWQDGQAWFWDTLVDADLANNATNWQWVAGCGVDAAPYFRIFNPVVQGEKFDPQGSYVRHWVPELAALANAYIHKPWLASASMLRSAGITLGEHYPAPIVDHRLARRRALDAFAHRTKAPP
jgi:deoxyribodipyrimidine photo-lyase